MKAQLNILAAKESMLAFVKDGEPSTHYTFDGLIKSFLQHNTQFQFVEAEQARKELFAEGLLCHGEGMNRYVVVSAESVQKCSGQ